MLMRTLRAPDRRLAPLLYRPLLGFEQRGGGFSRLLEPPRPALTLMVDVEGSIRADGVQLPDAWIAGLSDRYAIVEFGDTYASLDLELTPLGAYRLLGRPVSDLEGATASLPDLFGAAGRRLAERLRESSSWGERFDHVESFLLARAAIGPEPSPVVAWAYWRLWQSDGRMRVRELAAEAGCSRRHLSAAFHEQVGLSPKMTARLMRFQAVRRMIERQPVRWAEIAFDAGYADQAHLSRDFRDLAGTTPSDFASRLVPGGGVVGDDLPFVQDGAPGGG
jgi:AraC-like DNA-binding protein